ncbi:MAG: SpoIIE family protein phosphatase [Bacteroidetes bacterium]|nr:SpoIIE family protein phosphatase [Bacteroidota bacterium]
MNAHLKDYFILFKPKDVVSGDFYWAAAATLKSLATSSENNFYLVVADSTGHGVPGAIMSILNISCLDKAITEGITSPELILNETRRLIIENLKNDGSEEGGKDGMDGSLLRFDFENNILHCASATSGLDCKDFRKFR